MARTAPGGGASPLHTAYVTGNRVRNIACLVDVYRVAQVCFEKL